MKPLESLICACCGTSCQGRQFYNQDKGFGLCPDCSDMLVDDDGLEQTEQDYGKKGIYWI